MSELIEAIRVAIAQGAGSNDDTRGAVGLFSTRTFASMATGKRTWWVANSVSKRGERTLRNLRL